MAANDPPDDAPEPMRYQMLGEDDTATEEKLAKYTGDVDWSYLQPHFESEALIYVDPNLDLREVGRAFVDDDRVNVEGWFKSGDLVRPSQPHAEYWKNSGSRFTALVVSPFVLITPSSETSETDDA